MGIPGEKGKQGLQGYPGYPGSSGKIIIVRDKRKSTSFSIQIVRVILTRNLL
jgi:hypothetical protein